MRSAAVSLVKNAMVAQMTGVYPTLSHPVRPTVAKFPTDRVDDEEEEDEEEDEKG